MARSYPVEMTAVVPVLNEEENIEQMYDRLTRTLEQCVSSHEIVFVDDGSRDGSFQMLKNLHERDGRVKVIKFSRNFGQHPALAAGFRLARGEMVLCIDADMQSPPEEIPRLLAKFKEGYEVVYGHRVNRQDPLLRRMGSRVLYGLLSKTSLGKHVMKDVPFAASSSSFRLMSHDVVENLNRFEERTRFLAGMTAWLGFRSAAVDVAHAARERGKSKYGLIQLILMALDVLTGTSTLPLRLASAVGVLFSAAALLYAALIVINALLFGWSADAFSGYPIVLWAICFLGGIQLLFLGVLGEYLARVHQGVMGRPLFVVDRVIGSDEGDLQRLTGARETGKQYAGSRPAGNAGG